MVHISNEHKNAADEKLRQCMRKFCDSHKAPVTLVLLSGKSNKLLQQGVYCSSCDEMINQKCVFLCFRAIVKYTCRFAVTFKPRLNIIYI